MFFNLLFLFFFSTPVFALLEFEDAIFPEIVTSGRALGMGNAFICRTDDSGSVFYNPAGLGSVRLSHFHLTNLHLETNDELRRLTLGGPITEAPGNLTQAFSLEGTRKLLLENRGKFVHNRYNLMPNILLRYFSAGYMLAQTNNAFMDYGDTAKFEFATRRDYGPFAAINISLFGGMIKLGGSAVYLYRRQLIEDVDKDTPLVIQAGDYQRGRAVIGTAGFRWTLPLTFLPTIAITEHNATNAHFKSGSDAGAPPDIKPTIDVGVSITPQIANVVRMHLEAGYKDATFLYKDVNKFNKIVAGMELDFARKMFLRLGYGNGLGSGGIGIKSKRLEFDLTTYGVKVHTGTQENVPDRRYAITLSSGF